MARDYPRRPRRNRVHGAEGGKEVGVDAAEIRRRAMDGLGFLGVAYQANDSDGDREISPATAAVRAFVIEAREDLEIAREVNELLSPR
jgi:acetate kinase